MEKNLVDIVKNAGIVGAGGAGFPTHVKIDTKAQYVIINGAECEPLLRVDQQLAAAYPVQLMEGLKLVMEHTGAEKVFIALKGKYKSAVENISKIIGRYENVSLFILDNFYPAGDEQVLVYEVTKRIVPEGGIPLNVGTIVLNAETVLNIYNAYFNESSVTDKYVTLTGEVRNPVTLRLPVGITVKEAIALAGGSTCPDYVVVNGGPMMGKIVSENSPVTKTTKGLIVLPSDHPLIKDLNMDMSKMLREARTACMHCSLCTEVCPRNLIGHRLEPHKLIRMESYAGISNDKNIPGTAFLCCECRLCEYACVMNLKPWKVNSMLKAEMGKSGIKNTMHNTPEKAHPFREYKKFPVKRLVSKLGLNKYDTEAPLTETENQFTRVSIPLKQHIGAIAAPVVKAGDAVQKGDPVAQMAEGKMGSRIHASISGTIIEINKDTIIIDRSV